MLAMLAVAAIVPQSPSTASAGGFWTRPAVHDVVRALALDRILTAWPVALLFAAVAVSMAVATARHARVAYRRTFVVKRHGVRLAVDDPAEVRTLLRRAAFLRTAATPAGEKYVRNPWGYWGGVLLHAGLLLTVAAGLVLSVTEWRGVVRPAESEPLGPASRFEAQQRGVFAASPALPDTFTVSAASALYWPDRTLRQVETTLAFASGGPIGLRVNAPAVRDGIRYYQGQAHGHTFLVSLAREDGSIAPLRLDLLAPDAPDTPSYLGTSIPDGEYGLRAKYFLDADKRSMSGTPLLVLRLEKGGAEVAQAELRPGETAALGPYTATLDDVVVWTELVVVRDLGLPLVLLGFAVVVAGSALIYLVPPAAVHLIGREDGRYDVTWEPSRFARAMPPELSALLETAEDAA